MGPKQPHCRRRDKANHMVGPGSYSIIKLILIDVPTIFKSPSSTHISSPQFTIHGDKEHRLNNDSPGPGAYDRLDEGYRVFIYLFYSHYLLFNHLKDLDLELHHVWQDHHLYY